MPRSRLVIAFCPLTPQSQMPQDWSMPEWFDPRPISQCGDRGWVAVVGAWLVACHPAVKPNAVAPSPVLSVPAAAAAAEIPTPPELAPLDPSAPPPAEEWDAHGFGCDTLTLDVVAPEERERGDVFVIPAFAEAFARWSAERERVFEERGHGYSFTLESVRHCTNCESGIGRERIEYGSECAEGDMSFLVYSDGCTLRQSEVVFAKDCCDGGCPARTPEVWMTRFLRALWNKDGARLAPLFAPGRGTEVNISVGDEEPESFMISSSDDMQAAPLTLDSPLDAILAGYTRLGCDEQFDDGEWACSTVTGGYWVTYHWKGDADGAVLLRIHERGE